MWSASACWSSPRARCTVPSTLSASASNRRYSDFRASVQGLLRVPQGLDRPAGVAVHGGDVVQLVGRVVAGLVRHGGAALQVIQCRVEVAEGVPDPAEVAECPGLADPGAGLAVAAQRLLESVRRLGRLPQVELDLAEVAENARLAGGPTHPAIQLQRLGRVPRRLDEPAEVGWTLPRLPSAAGSPSSHPACAGPGPSARGVVLDGRRVPALAAVTSARLRCAAACAGTSPAASAAARPALATASQSTMFLRSQK